MTKISTLRPGLLVGIKTSVTGNVQYSKHDLDPDRPAGEGESVAKWETLRVINDVAEHEKARKAQSEARYLITRLCASTAFGCLCPEDRAQELSEAIEKARGIIDAFNAEARITRVRLYVIAGRVAPDDVEAARAIRAELAQVIGDMERGVAALAPTKVREAARKAQELAEMLNDASKQRVAEAVEAARKAARMITKAVVAGEQAALVIDGHLVQKMEASRLAFLDIEPEDAKLNDSVIPQPQVAPRAVDFSEV